MNATLGPDSPQIAKMREVILRRLPAAHAARRRRRAVTGGAIGIAALASFAAAAAIAPASVDQRNVSVDCYTTANLTSAHTTTTIVDDGRDRSTLQSLTVRTQQALALCAADRTAVATDPQLRVKAVDVPDPTVCQLADLRLAVLPNRNQLDPADFCTQLGLSEPSS